VHSIAAALLLNRSQVHFFDDIGYRHNPFMHCPIQRELQLKCHCDPAESFDWSFYSCTKKWFEVTTK